MTTIDQTLPSSGNASRTYLKATGVIWFVVAAIGQVAFIAFIVSYYGQRTVAGDFAAWNDKPLIDGHIEGDLAGNLMFVIHVLLAAVITFGGLLQLVPQIRNRFRTFHRWNGRVFIAIAGFMAIGGLWLTWGRGTQLSSVSAIAISVNALLILLFAGLALRYAMARQIETHRRWAMRTFMVVNGVWFLRVGIMAWVLINQGPRGMNQTLSGPADIALVFGCYLIPLAMLELYFRAQQSAANSLKILVGSAVLLMTGVMAIGIFGTVAFMWGPYL